MNRNQQQPLFRGWSVVCGECHKWYLEKRHAQKDLCNVCKYADGWRSKDFEDIHNSTTSDDVDDESKFLTNSLAGSNKH